MSEMVERVAAIFAAELLELTAEQRARFVFPDDTNGDTCERARSSARAAIEAMREPTEEMIESGRLMLLAGLGMTEATPEGDAKWVWLEMIDAVLGQKP